jgi:hypothetical protein
MHPTGQFFIALTVVVVIVLIALTVWRARQERAREAEISQWAASRGWTVTPKAGAIEWTSRLPGTNRRGVSLILSGTVSGWPVRVAEYSYTTTSSSGPDGASSSTTHRYVVTAVRLAAWYAPVAVQPRGGISRLGKAIFGDNAAATGHPDFDRQVRVDTKDPATSHALVGPALIAEHLAGQIPAWSLAGQDLFAWQEGKITDPSRIEPPAAGLIRVATLIGH